MSFRIRIFLGIFLAATAAPALAVVNVVLDPTKARLSQRDLDDYADGNAALDAGPAVA